MTQLVNKFIDIKNKILDAFNFRYSKPREIFVYLHYRKTRVLLINELQYEEFQMRI